MLAFAFSSHYTVVLVFIMLYIYTHPVDTDASTSTFSKLSNFIRFSNITQKHKVHVQLDVLQIGVGDVLVSVLLVKN